MQEHTRFNGMLKTLGLEAVSNEHAFLKMREALEHEFASLEKRGKTLYSEIELDRISLKQYEKEEREIATEIDYFQNNPSNIDKRIATIRDSIADRLGIEKENLPFVGEHLKVVDEAWSGAIERTLRSTALELLVDERYYDTVSRYVNETNLKGKLVFRKAWERNGTSKMTVSTLTTPPAGYWAGRIHRSFTTCRRKKRICSRSVSTF